MTGLPWYKHEPARFLRGMVGLTPAERGAYITVVDSIYVEGGPVKDDPSFWAGMFAIPQPAWLKLRAALIAKGKLFQTHDKDGVLSLMNRYCADEIGDQLAYKSAQAARGAKGGSKSRRKPRSDKGLSKRSAGAKQALSERLPSAKEIEREIKTPSPIQEGTRDTTRASDSSTTAEIIPLDGRAGR